MNTLAGGLNGLQVNTDADKNRKTLQATKWLPLGTQQIPINRTVQNSVFQLILF